MFFRKSSMILILHALLLQRYWPKRHGTKYTSARKDSSRDERVFGCYYRRGDVLYNYEVIPRCAKTSAGDVFAASCLRRLFFPLNSLKYLKGSRNNSLDLGKKIYS